MYPDNFARVNVSQADTSDALGLETVEIKGAEFPWDKNKIAAEIRAVNNCAVRASVNYAKRGWCLYTVKDDHLTLHRLTIIPDDNLYDILEKIFDTLAFTPGSANRPSMSIVWPEFGTDNFLFDALISPKFAFEVNEVLKDEFFAYNQNYDGYNLVRQF